MRGGLRVLSGAEVVDILAAYGFAVVAGRKHLKLRRSVLGGTETLIVPDHDPIAKGTLRAIFAQASRYIPQAELRPHFYNE